MLADSDARARYQHRLGWRANAYLRRRHEQQAGLSSHGLGDGSTVPDCAVGVGSGASPVVADGLGTAGDGDRLGELD
ncbi:hypothetical protein K1W54_29870 [Micromonospora sp. CPCC 205371]|nr:hypothetical protein [Micromonospora sp. CPCC 205371]